MLDDRFPLIYLNFETTGFRWWAGDKPIAASVTYGDKTQYLPWGHAGGNLDEAVVKRWFQEQVKHKHIVNTNTRFEVHMARVWGLDLEEQGNTVADVSHYAALLDDHRERFALDVLINDYLGHPPEIGRLDESRMISYHAGEAAPRAEYQTKVVKQLYEAMMPELDRQNLTKVRLVEEQLIYPVCEMEKNGAKIDVEKLHRWVEESEKILQNLYLEIFHETGIKMNFGSSNDMEKLFIKLGVEFGGTTAGGAPSFTDAILKKIEHPTIKKARRGQRLKSLRNKYLLKYLKNVGSDGILRYALHQLRESREAGAENSDDEAGTGFGRFSSTGLNRNEGTNIQQTIKVSSQIKNFGDEFIIRELHIAEEGDYLSTDAMQVEYRFFAHEANTPAVIEAYKKDPEMSFHKYMWEVVKKYQPDFSYRQQKDLNFAKIYGAGIKKMALMLGFITVDQYKQLLRDQADSNHPWLQSTVMINGIYNQVLPEVKPLNNRAMQIARERGYIKTILGRRARFPGELDIHKALNRRIQGSAADIMKVKTIEVHRERKNTGFTMRFPVHDSLDGDARGGKETADKVKAILNRQSFPSIRVPILFEMKTGANWRVCTED